MIKNCLARIGCLTIVMAILAAGWWLREDLAGLWNRLEITSASEPSEDLARRAALDVEEFFGSDSGGELTLTQAEIQSLLTFRMQGLLPPGIHGTEIEIGDSTLVLSARVDPRELRGMASPELLERFLSDSARVAAELAPEVLQPGVASLRVVALQAGSLVIPSLMVPWILGGVEIPGAEVTGSAVLLPVPGTVRQFAVINGRLHLKTVDD